MGCYFKTMSRERLREFGTPKRARAFDLSPPLTNKRPRQLVFDDSSDESPPTSHGEDESFDIEPTSGKSKMSQLAQKGRVKKNNPTNELQALYALQQIRKFGC